MTISHWLLLVAVSTAFAAALTPLARALAWWTDIVDRPAARKAVTGRVMPLLGGVPVFVSCWAVTIGAILLLPEIRAVAGGRHGLVAAAGGAGLAMLLLGILDDWQGLRARGKLLLELAVALALVSGGFKFAEAGFHALGAAGPLPLGWLAVPVSVIWIAGIINAVNLVDGVDGLATGTCVIIAAAIALVAALCGNPAVAVAAAAFAGACAGLLVFNFSPASIFLGDSGSLFAGATLAVLALGSVQGLEGLAGLAIPMLLLGYPALDTAKVMTGRFLTGKPLMSGDRGHIHHRLLHHGYGHARTALTLHGVAAAFCLPAIGLAAGDPGAALAGAAVLLAVLGWGAVRFGYLQRFSPAAMWHQRPRYQAVHHRTRLAAAELELAADFDQALEILTNAAPHYGVVELELEWPRPAAATGANGGAGTNKRLGASEAGANGSGLGTNGGHHRASGHGNGVAPPAPRGNPGAGGDESGATRPAWRIVLHPAGTEATEAPAPAGDGHDGAPHGARDGNGAHGHNGAQGGNGAAHDRHHDRHHDHHHDPGRDAAAAGNSNGFVRETFRCPRSGLEARMALRPDPALPPALQLEQRSEFNALLGDFACRVQALGELALREPPVPPRPSAAARAAGRPGHPGAGHRPAADPGDAPLTEPG